jgi:hypothetical protein
MSKSIAMPLMIALILIVSSSSGAMESYGPGYRSGMSVRMINEDFRGRYGTMQARIPQIDIVDAPSIERKTNHLCPHDQGPPKGAAEQGRDMEGNDRGGPSQGGRD